MLKNLKNYVPKEAEKEILEFWTRKKIFEKSVAKSYKLKAKSYIFYDGPPFATGTPHYGHIVASTMKDVVPRYWTMKGYKVERKWGWDCHGLPIENIAEKELGIKRKKEIEEMGVAKFNEFCRSKVLDYVDEWKKIISKLGRWADMENAYKTMDVSYMESVWWVFKELWDKGLIYEGYRSMHICTRCETTLSQQEVAEGYKDIKDLSATVKFHLKTGQKWGNGKYETKDAVYILAWTTTPWTLIGNVALAVGKNINYTALRLKGIRELLIVASDRLENVFKDKEIEIVHNDIKGQDLIGLEYDPFFEISGNLQNKENGWKIYAGDFVTTEDGTGVVHIAPAFGEDDLNLGQKNNLPFIQHVGMDGIIKPGFEEFSGLSVKPKGNPKETDEKIVNWLKEKDKLFTSELYEHSYPHCWRCDTPLINYATSSWFVNILKVKGKALQLAKKINWVPEHIKEGRFGNWLEGARDWSISRQRYWASVMPIWKCQKCNKIKVIGSLEDLKNNTKQSGNNYFLMRHGEAETNNLGIFNCNISTNHFHLTNKGKEQVLISAKKLIKTLRQTQGKKIDLIFSSDFLRTKETAEMVAQEINYDKSKIIYDPRLREVNGGIFDGGKLMDYVNFFASAEERFVKEPEKGENFLDLKKRVGQFIYETDKKYSGKNILIVSHEAPIWQLISAAKGFSIGKSIEFKGKKFDAIKTGEFTKLNFVPLPHKDDFELDIHKPYVDEIHLSCPCGGEMKRITDVLDTWFDSGSMPYAQVHYPFEDKKKFDKNFPAQFIAEGVDQTRAWFYYLHAISTAIKNSNAYKNVIVNGIVLAEDGKKMSKRLQNYPDPAEVLDKYGADALRLYLMSSPVVKAENLNFSEKGVDELYKKVISRLWNSFMFYQTYAEQRGLKRGLTAKIQRKSAISQRKSANPLDAWILARLNQLIREMNESMERYELDKASRPIIDFVDDLSTWYIRRSRTRFATRGITRTERKLTQEAIKKDKENAQATTKFVLVEFSKAVAPFMPFIAEAIYQLMDGKKESVHLETWPASAKATKSEVKLLAKMAEVRKVVEDALALRATAGIKVRQPLQKLTVKSEKLKGQKGFLNLIKEEINVKEIIFSSKIKEKLELDAKITPELKAEGQVRELIRMVQDLRKDAGYTPKDKIELFIDANDYLSALIKKNEEQLKTDLGVKKLEYGKSEKFDAESDAKIDENKIWLGVKKN